MPTRRRELVANNRQLGLGFFHDYYPQDHDLKFTRRKFTHEYHNGVIRQVWTTEDGRAYMSGWFRKAGTEFREWGSDCDLNPDVKA